VVHDQRRVVTPSQAALAGARYIVVGRAVTAATDPAAAMEAIVSELESVAV
jgi:orotidine-5'-phosphate decarboxylase